MTRTTKITLLALGAGLLWQCSRGPQSSESRPAQHSHHTPAAAEAASIPAATHGLVVFGEDALYASHIPMYDVPHDWQVIFGVRLAHPEADAEAAYRNFAYDQDHNQKLMTIQPQPFILPEAIEGRLQEQEGILFSNNFEDSVQRRERLAGMFVKFAGLPLHVHHLSHDLPGRTHLSYFLTRPQRSGEHTVSYLIHEITAPDNFDQIVQVRWGSLVPALEWFGDRALLRVEFSNRADSISARLARSEILLVQAPAGATDVLSAVARQAGEASDDDSSAGSAVGAVVSDFYCTPGPGFFGNCPARP